MFNLKVQFLVALASCLVCECKQYRNYTLYRGIPVSEVHLSFFQNLSRFYEVNFWRQPGNLNFPVEFTISPNDKSLFLEEADKQQIYLTTIEHDIQQAFDKQIVKKYIRRRMSSFDWESYHRLDDIYGWMQDLSDKNPDEVKVFSIGQTAENRDIKAMKVVLAGARVRSKVIIEGGIHAREWISPAVVTYLINKIVGAGRCKDNKDLSEVALAYEWYFIPVVNPDGYEYSHTTDRLWRKNRQEFKNGIGVDLNRNFGFAFSKVGVRTKPKSEIFCGFKPFSEKESWSLATFIKKHANTLEFYIGFHSYGQLMVIPYAHSRKHYDNFEEMKEILENTSKIMKRTRDIDYKIGTAYDTVGYLASGVSSCWVKRAFRVPYVVTFELPDMGRYGFALPADQINSTVKETMEGFTYLLKPKDKPFEKLADFTGTESEDKLYNVGSQEAWNSDEVMSSGNKTESVNSEYYRGPKGFSETESKALRDFVTSKSDDLGHYFSLHSYGHVFVMPYVPRKESLDTFKIVTTMCEEAIANISTKTDTIYTCGTLSETFGYNPEGSTAFWVKETFNVSFVVTIYLGDNGDFGFALPTSMITTAGEEALTGIQSLLSNRTQVRYRVLLTENEPLHQPSRGHTYYGPTRRKLVSLATFLNDAVCLRAWSLAWMACWLFSYREVY